MGQGYRLKEASRLLGLSEGRLRRWCRLGLVAPRRSPREGLAFDFQGLVALRTIKQLRRRGVPLGRIKKCVETLRRLYPGLAQPLAQARIQVGPPFLVAKKSRRFTPEGQLYFNFNKVHAEPLSVPPEQLDRLFFLALDKEQQGEWEGAKKLYSLILALKPEYPDALVNLGNILYRLGFPEGAATYYLKALDCDAHHPEANYNLATILEDQGDLREAATLYRRALQGEPQFPEACFNLARVLERLGDRQGARQYWRRYLELDPQGEWASFFRPGHEDPEGEPPDKDFPGPSTSKQK